MEINKRITKVIEESKLSPSEFAEKIDVQRSSISHITSGRNKPSLEFIIKIKNAFPDIQWDWLINGIEPMIAEVVEINNNETEEVERKLSLPDLFSLIDDDNFGHTESEDRIVGSNTSEVIASNKSTRQEEILDSQRLDFPTQIEPKKHQKVAKKIVFFYEDGSFETFEN